MTQITNSLPIDIKYINIVSTKDTNAIIKVTDLTHPNLYLAMLIIDALDYNVKLQFEQDTLTIISDKLTITRIDKIISKLVKTTIELSKVTYLISNELKNKIQTALSSNYFKDTIS